MLFKAYPGSDNIKIIWMIPDRHIWKQYQYGFMTENKTITESIHLFQNDRNKLDQPDPDDLSDVQIDAIYRSIALSSRQAKTCQPSTILAEN